MEEYRIDAEITPNLDVEEIENDHMYLMGIVQDCSGSMDEYTSDMRKALASFIESVKGSKSDDEMLVCVTNFDSDVRSSGFQNVDDIDTNFQAGGMTSLFDAIIVMAKLMKDYKDELNGTGVRTRGGIVIFSDGDDNNSRNSANAAAQVIKLLLGEEVVVAFVAFGDEAHGIADNLGIPSKNVLETDATPSELRRIWGIISKSAISSSKSAAAGASQQSFFDV